MKKRSMTVGLVLLAAVATGTVLEAQDPRPGEPGYTPPPAKLLTKTHFGSSPFNPPKKTDTAFVVDQASGLDTGCTFRGGGPLIFSIEVDRVVGDVAKLKQNQLISEKARLQMPAFDVDFDANIPGINPERDRVSFNGNVVPDEFLTGSNGVWKFNTFNVEIDWVNFAKVNGAGPPTPGQNEIRIDIDVANGDEFWCTAIDWASLDFEVVRPVVMAHGILSEGAIWNNVWAPQLQALGMLTETDLNMGNLDSIGNNAAKIKAKVEEVKKRWGVERVSIVSHSKGGLDSRHYAENDDSVDYLVQLGTPNAGAPLANVAQAGSVVLFGLGGTAIVNALAGPAGIQLTTWYMSSYNSSHGSNPKVQYTAMAGNYDPDCFFCVTRLMTAITGPGDTIVPVTSVHALPYTLNRTFFSVGANEDATHSGLHASVPVYNQTSDRVRRFGRPKTVEPELVRTATVGGELLEGASAIETLLVDEAAPTLVGMMFPSGEVDLVLVTPSGRRIDPAAAAADPDIDFEVTDILGGRMAAYGFAVPEVGEWSAEVAVATAEDPALPVGYSLNVWIEDPAVRFSGSFGRESLPVGDALELFGALTDSGSPATGATATAHLLSPGGTSFQVALTDDGQNSDVVAGDGVYSGALSPVSESGYYRVAFTAIGTNAAGSAFSREDFGLASVSASRTALGGTYRDFGQDTDSDGFFNELVVEVDLTVTDPGQYRVFAVLIDAAGNRHEARSVVNLVPGPATVELAFDGEAIFDNRIDGPYTLAEVRVVEEDDFLVLPVDEAFDAHVSVAYSFAEFQHGPIVLTGAGSAVGLDFNANGLFDFLEVEVEVEVERSGFYRWSAQLVDAQGNELGFDSRSAFWSAGSNDMLFFFDGSAIGESGVDGPYFISSLLLFGAGADLVANDAFATPAFEASQFEGFVFDTTPPEIEVSVDPSVLWPPQHQMVQVTATVAVTDDIDPNPTVELVSVTSSEDDDGLGDGHTSDDVQEADLGTDDRQILLRAERSGVGEGRTYTLTYRARDAAGNTADAVAIVTVPHNRGK